MIIKIFIHANRKGDAEVIKTTELFISLIKKTLDLLFEMSLLCLRFSALLCDDNQVETLNPSTVTLTLITGLRSLFASRSRLEVVLRGTWRG